jgi:hypothetical protein
LPVKATTEVRAFLKEKSAGGREKSARVSGPTPLGRWKFRVRGGPVLSGAGTFRRDGTFVLSRPGRPLEGRYACANGLVWLIFRQGLAEGRLAWHGKDHFSLKVGDSEMSFDRQVPKLAGRGRSTAVTIANRAARAPAPGYSRRATPIPGKSRPGGSAGED